MTWDDHNPFPFFFLITVMVFLNSMMITFLDLYIACLSTYLECMILNCFILMLQGILFLHMFLETTLTMTFVS